MKSFTDKVVVITGAGSGIGRALAQNFAARGAKLALSDVDEAGLADTVRLLGSVSARSDRLDVRDRTAMAAYAASVAEEFGAVNVVINNAGVALTGSVLDMTYADLEWIVDIDFWGVVNGTKEFLPYLIDSGDGHLVNLSSLFGLLAVPGQSAYNAAKFAVRGFTEALRQEMLVAGHPVAVSCVHPGGIKTAIARNARVAGAEDQAALADYFDRKLAKTSPAKAAEIIVAGMLAGKPKIVVGADAKVLDLLVKVLGARYQNVLARVSKKQVPQPKAISNRSAV
ncbi:MAG: SDR family NAD(P)-dependent oxidoreductase [Actinomycetota bacterium]|nr:SDR family NAD(P)-dependent oxidoreductase [Actinomycetota bacterium]MDQ2957158.1 SDR family NAD(P)-dependent oxidoreductase [Actinomycetota bacterium]